MKDVENTRVFIYSLVCYDEENANVIPVSEILTNEQTQSNIELFLFTFKNILKNNIKVANSVIWAPIIVTDCIWTLIGAIHTVFNNLTISQYISWCYDILFDEKKSNVINNRLATRTILCASHFLKSIAKKAKQLTNDETIFVKKAFLYAFSLLQNCSSMNEFEHYFLHLILIYLFNEQSKNEKCLTGIKTRKNAIKTRNLDYVNKILNNEQELCNIDDEIKETVLLNNSNDAVKESEASLKQQSPFTKYFKKWFADKKLVLNKTSAPINLISEPNFYYNPKLIELIVEYLHTLPLWTGFTIQKWQQLFPKFDLLTRITNNLVENWFGNAK
jgi:hypothetical protein